MSHPRHGSHPELSKTIPNYYSMLDTESTEIKKGLPKDMSSHVDLMAYFGDPRWHATRTIEWGTHYLKGNNRESGDAVYVGMVYLQLLF